MTDSAESKANVEFRPKVNIVLASKLGSISDRHLPLKVLQCDYEVILTRPTTLHLS